MLAHKFEQITLTRTGLGVINTLKYFNPVKTGAKAHHIQVGLPNAIYPTGLAPNLDPDERTVRCEHTREGLALALGRVLTPVQQMSMYINMYGYHDNYISTI